MAKSQHHLIFWIVGGGAGAWAAYELVYKPWAAHQAALAAAGGGALTGPLSSFPALPALPSPAAILSSPPPAIIPSNLDPGAAVGGVVGACMQRKGNTWTQLQCQTRLDALVQAAKNAKLAISQLQTAANPAAAGIPAAQAQLAAEQAALVQAQQAYNQLVASGDTTGAAAAYAAAILGHQSDISELNARIAAAQQPANNAAAIAAYQGALAANDNDYFNLTGVHLLSQI